MVCIAFLVRGVRQSAVCNMNALCFVYASFIIYKTNIFNQSDLIGASSHLA